MRARTHARARARARVRAAAPPHRRLPTLTPPFARRACPSAQSRALEVADAEVDAASLASGASVDEEMRAAAESAVRAPHRVVHPRAPPLLTPHPSPSPAQEEGQEEEEEEEEEEEGQEGEGQEDEEVVGGSPLEWPRRLSPC